MAEATTHIATQTVSGGSTASIVFSSIPSTYDDLILIGSGRCDNSSDYQLYFDIRLNSDANSNYTLGHGYAQRGTNSYGSNVDANLVAQWRINNLPGTALSETAPGSFYMYMPGYSETTTKKNMVWMSGSVLSNTNYVTRQCSTLNFKGFGLYNATGGISHMTLTTLYGYWVAGSSYSLYGINNS